MNKTLVMRILNTVLFAAMAAANILANVLPIGDFSTGQISAMYPTLITPPGWTFAIWGLIYALLAVFAVRQLVSKPFYESLDLGPFFLLSCLMNISWIFSWHFQNMTLALLSILALFVLLLIMYQRTGDTDFLTKTTFSIYFAWITVAALIMIFAAVKTFTGHAPITPIVPRDSASSAVAIPAMADSFTGIVLISGTPEIVSYVTVFEYIMAVGALIILLILAAEHTRRYKDPAYLAVILWALAGVLIRQVTSVTPPVLFNIVCGVVMSIIAYLMINIFNARRKEKAMNTKSKVKIYECRTCGNLIFKLEDSGVTPVCCGADMEEITPKTTDEFREKHVPVITRIGDRVVVSVGEMLHPMNDAHHINWILLETNKGIHLAYLKAEPESIARFTLCKGETVVAAYANCNLHGLWMGVCC